PDRDEALDGLAADAAGRAVRRGQLGVLFFELLQLVHEPVVLPVGDFRLGLDVVLGVVVFDLPAEFVGALCEGGHSRYRSGFSGDGGIVLAARSFCKLRSRSRPMLRTLKTTTATNSASSHFQPSARSASRKGEGGGWPASMAFCSKVGTTA